MILRRELIQKKDHDPEALRNVVIPQIIQALQKRINQGELDIAAEDSDLGSDNDDNPQTSSKKDKNQKNMQAFVLKPDKNLMDPDGDSVMK